jgi:hypothetical protein
LTKFSHEITLDGDKVSIREAKSMFSRFIEIEEPISASLHLSPLKGFHVRAKFSQTVDNWRMRDKWKDDGKRLVHTIFSHPDGIKALNNSEEFFWDGKIIEYGKDRFVIFEEILLAEFRKVRKCHTRKIQSRYSHRRES